jgi:predicted MFS family arabinose efflux permease
VGGVAGFIAGLVVGAIPQTWRKNAILSTFALLLSPIIYLIFKEPDFPATLGAGFTGWLLALYSSWYRPVYSVLRATAAPRG